MRMILKQGNLVPHEPKPKYCSKGRKGWDFCIELSLASVKSGCTTIILKTQNGYKWKVNLKH